MCAQEGMALAPWGALGGGNFKTEEQRQSGEGRQMGGPSENDIAVSKVLEKKAKEKGTVMTSIAFVSPLPSHPPPRVRLTSSRTDWRTSWPKRPTSSPSSAAARRRT